MTEFNATQTGGIKSLAQIQKKYKNIRAAHKKISVNNAKEMRKTGGGAAVIEEGSSFNFAEEEIRGLVNEYDNDATVTGENLDQDATVMDVEESEMTFNAVEILHRNPNERHGKRRFQTPYFLSTVNLPEFNLIFHFSGQKEGSSPRQATHRQEVKENVSQKAKPI